MTHMHTATAGGAFLLSLLALFFSAGVVFYLFRLLNPRYLRRVNGHWDGENELWHGVCLAAMVPMLVPSFYTVLAPSTVALLGPLFWLLLLAFGSTSYLYRAFTYGQKIPGNKRWYDFAHAAMLFGMAWMIGQPLLWPTVPAFLAFVFAAYWLWFAAYYLWRLGGDFKNPHWLTIGQDILHMVMAVVMILMTVQPSIFMPSSMSMPGQMPDPMPICSPATN